jgi:hypothetical protein
VFSLMLVVLVPLLIISFSAVVYGFYLTLNWLPTQMLKDISRAETSQLPFVVIADSLFALVIVGTYLLVFGVTIWGASCAIKSVFQKR